MTVQDQGRQGEIPGEPFEEGVEHGTHVLSLWGEGYFCWAVVLTPLRTPRAAFVDGWLPLGCCLSLAGSFQLGCAPPARRASGTSTAPGC